MLDCAGGGTLGWTDWKRGEARCWAAVVGDKAAGLAPFGETAEGEEDARVVPRGLPLELPALPVVMRRSCRCSRERRRMEEWRVPMLALLGRDCRELRLLRGRCLMAWAAASSSWE